jgi:NAD(P)-dependent dehydrogenase (short-subunit alcohol dehydrogenase family)
MKKTALITGGSRGIGLGIAMELARAGFDLVINGVREEAQVSDALEQIRGEGHEVRYAQGDISAADDRQRIVESAVEAFGHIGVLVNNAGMASLERLDILEAGEESFDRLMAVNLKAPYFLTQLVAQHMIEAKKKDRTLAASIIFVTSVSATMASVNRGDYCISKAGLSMAARLWAVRLGEFGIPVYEIRPGVIRSDMTAGVKEKYDRLIEEGLFVEPRWGEPGDVGKVAAAMATGSMPYATGQAVIVDGGLSIPRL